LYDDEIITISGSYALDSDSVGSVDPDPGSRKWFPKRKNEQISEELSVGGWGAFHGALTFFGVKKRYVAFLDHNFYIISIDIFTY
jgi:hypothetical protein